MIIKGMIKNCYLAKQPKITDNTYNVSITGDAEEEILYTVDGTDPIINGIVYKAPFKVDKDCIVEARTVNKWSYSSSTFVDVKKSKTEIKLLTTRYQDLRMKGQSDIIFDSPLALQNGKGQTPGIYNEWTMFLAISYCISLNANIYDATYTTASGNTEGFKISVKNGDLYFDVYREGVIDESIVLAEKFGVEVNSYLGSPVPIIYLIINSKGQINGEQKFKPIIANGEPTIPHSGCALCGEDDLVYGFADFCIYSGIKEELEDFYITYESIESAGKVELYASSDDNYIKARGRGNIYITNQPVSEYVGVKPDEGYLYTGYDYDKRNIRNYTATPYAGITPVASRTTKKTIYHTAILRQDINASNFENGEKVFALEDDKTIFLYFKQFVPSSYGSEIVLFQISDENNLITHEIVLTAGTGLQIKHNGEYSIFYPYDSTQPLNYLIGISKTLLSIKENYTNTGSYLSDVPSNAKIEISVPTVSMPSDWEIGRIAVTDNGELHAAFVDEQVFYGPLYD